jgi:DNA-binding MarR family transcriptional regulator
MADYEVALGALARIRHACRAPFVRDPGGGPRISAHRARVLAYLDEEDPAMVGELAEHLGVSASTMSLTLGRLEEAGYVRRDRDPLDGRVVNVRLTRAGARARDARRDVDPERMDRLLAFLTPEERPEVLRALVRLGAAADRLAEREREDLDAQL